MAQTFDLKTEPLRIRVAGPVRTGLEVRFHRFGKNYERFRMLACAEVDKSLQKERGDMAPAVRCPLTAHGETDDEAAGERQAAPEWLGFGSQPYVPTALIQLDQTIDTLELTGTELRACAELLGCADEAGCARFDEISILGDHMTARIHDTGIVVLTVHMKISGPEQISTEELRPVIDCAVEAAKQSVEARYERVRHNVANGIRRAVDDHQSERPISRRPPRSYFLYEPEEAWQDDAEAVRKAGYGGLIAFHRLIELSYGGRLSNMEEAKEACYMLLEISHSDGLAFRTPHPDYAAYLGYLNSVYIYPRDCKTSDRTRRLSPLPVIQFYEFAFAALQEVDRLLFEEVADSPRVLEEIARLGRAEREERYLRAQDDIWDLRERARLLDYRTDSDIDTLPPAHLTYWDQIVASWRVATLRGGIAEKVDFLEQHYAHIQERMENDLTRRTNTIILFLTGITALSVTADTLGFLLDADAWTWRPWKLGSLALGSLTIGLIAWIYWRRTHRSELSRLERARRMRSGP